VNTICILAAAVILTGCTVTRYAAPTGETFSRTSFGTRLSVGELTVTAGTNGVRTITIKGYANDQVEAIGVAVDAAVSAAVKAVKP
jgi:hypothetical protein